MINELNSHMMFEFMLAALAFLVSMALTPFYTHLGYKYKWWKKQRSTATTGENLEVVTALHKKKFRKPFPTMAGIVMVLVVVGLTVWLNLSRGETWLPVVAFLGGGAVGLLDDLINIFGNGKGVAGLRTWLKFLLIAILGLALGWFFAYKLGWTGIMIPFFGSLEIGAPAMMLLFTFAVVSVGNAVNISDGLDGLAGGLAMIAYGAFGVIAMMQGQYALAGFCMTVVGTLLAYIWFNVPPARFMMGDVGSFALGAGLGVVAMMTQSFLLLPLIGGVFVVEVGSSLIQIVSKKLFGRKVFIAAPIHHHLEAKGWSEAGIVMRLWVIAGMLAVLGVFVSIASGVVVGG